MVLRELQRPEEATAALAQALRSVPCLWAAWTELASLNADYEGERTLALTLTLILTLTLTLTLTRPPRCGPPASWVGRG